jgi:ribose-phosphate pyrophosphokinase
MLLLAFPGCDALARTLAEALGADPGRIEWRHFPDGESLVTLHGEFSGRDIAVLATLRDPDRLALPLVFASRTARELGARSVGLVAPYLGYMRQDTRFEPGQAVSSAHFGAFLAWTFDWLATVDPHLHRQRDLRALFGGRAEAVTAVPLVADWIRAHVADPVLIGPDAESAQWLEPLARLTGAPVVVLAKERRGDREVRISEPASAEIARRTPILFDDIVSTGQTMIQATAHLREAGASAPICIAVHGVFADGAERWLRVAGAGGVITTNTIDHATNAIDVAPALAAAVLRRWQASPATTANRVP